MSETIRHLYEGAGTGVHLRAVSLCKKDTRYCSPVTLTRMQREADPECPACRKVQVARLGKGVLQIEQKRARAKGSS